MRMLLAAALVCPALAQAQSVPTTVLWYRGNGGIEVDPAFSNYVSSVLGGSVVEFSGDITTADLDDYRYVVVARPQLAFSPAQVAHLQEFLDANGLLVVAGESNIGGLTYITSINTLLTDLGVSMQLEDFAYQNPDIDGDGNPDCNLTDTVTSTAILPSTTELSVIDVGDIDPGNATVISAYLYNDPNLQITINVQILAIEGRVVLSADGDHFSSSTCGGGAKQTFWNGLWTSVCDLDEDGVASERCGGQDCFDNDPSIGSAFLWADHDGDGFGDPDDPEPCGSTDTVVAVSVQGDCDDTNPDRNPDEAEVCNGIDDDCDLGVDVGADDALSWYPDFDDDGFGRIDGEETVACEQPDNHVADATDCDDAEGDTYPGADETCGNNVDDNCSDVADEGCPGDTNDPIDPPPKKCGCASGTGGAGVLAMLGAAVAFRRRARR